MVTIKLKNNTFLEKITKQILKDFLHTKKPPQWLKNVLIDEKAERSYSYPTYIRIAVKYDWSPMAICEMFIHEQFHYYAQHLDKSDINKFLVYVKQHYKWNRYEFTDFDNFAEHLVVCTNTIIYMRKHFNSTDEYLANGSIYKTFVWYIIKHWKKVTNDLKKFNSLYKK